jgi:hypothetical protein
MNKNSDTKSHQITTALDHARRLSESRPDGAHRDSWSAQAAHVGDLSVLALALRDR